MQRPARHAAGMSPALHKTILPVRTARVRGRTDVVTPGSARAVGISASDCVTVSDRADAIFTPADQTRDWRRRWREIQRQDHELMAPLPSPMTSDAIHTARQRLHNFYVQAYHLKDSLIADASATGVSRVQVEAAINQEPFLALLADLANMEKHVALGRQPRSGAVPQFGRASGSSKGLADPGWRIQLVIQHGTQQLDGLNVADDAVKAWRRVLTNWGLLGP